MNKLTISEGGQPVVLEDLLLLQDNAHAMISNILSLIMNGAKSFLSSKPTNFPRYKDESKEIRRIGKSTLYYEGYAYDIPSVDLELSAESDVYVCIKHEETDFRQFEDLQSRACRELLVGYYSNTSDGAYKAWLLSELPIWGISGGGNEISGDIPVKWVNGYSGNLSSVASRVNRVFTLNISSASLAWSDANEDGMLGSFVENESSDYVYLLGKKTPSFISGGAFHYLEFTEDGAIFLRAENTSGAPLLSNIIFEWTLTEMESR